MAISLRAAGTMTDEAAAVTAVNPAYPAGLQANDISILSVAVKPYTATITTPSGWTKLGEKTSGTRAATVEDTGSVKEAIYYRVGSFSGSLGNIGQSGATDLSAVINSYQCGAGETWDVTYTDGAQTSVVTNYSATGAANLNLAAGDWLIAATAASHLQNAGAFPTSETLTATGATMGTLTVRQEYYNYASWDIWHLFWDRPVTSGTSSAAPVQTWTWTTTQEGATAFVRLRVTASSTAKSDSDTASGADSGGSLAATATGVDTGTGSDANPSRSFAPAAYAMKYNDATGQTPGTAVTVGNSAASGSALTVVVATNGTTTYETTPDGTSTAFKVYGGGTGAGSFSSLSWASVGGTGAHSTFDMMVTGFNDYISYHRYINSDNGYSLTLFGGTLRIRDSITLVDLAVGSYAYSLNTWYRFKVDSAAGVGCTVSTYSRDGMLLETVVYTGTFGVPADTRFLRLYIGYNRSAQTQWIDNIVYVGSDNLSEGVLASEMAFLREGKSDADTGTGTDSAGNLAASASSSETGTGVDNAGSLASALPGADTASGTDSAGTVAQKYTGTDTATGVDNAGTLVQKYTGTDSGTGTDNAGSLAATASSSDTATGTDAVAGKGNVGTDTATGTDNAGTLIEKYTGAPDTATGTDSAGTLVQKYTGSDTGTAAETPTNRTFIGLPGDTATSVEAGSVANLAPTLKSGSDTVSRVEGQTVLTPGTFTQIPDPITWSNGDDTRAGTLNKEWRDTFDWLLRRNSPAFEGYNGDGASLTFTPNVAIPIKTDELVRGNLTHAANDTKVYVWESGWYLIWVQVGVTLTGVTGTAYSSVLKVNGSVSTTGDTTRAAGNQLGVEHQSSVYLDAGDYVEFALGGSWSGTATAVATSFVLPMLGLWWRTN